MPIVECPACGEDEALTGRREGDRIQLVCDRCGAGWDRDTSAACRLCGSEDIEGIPTSTLQEAGRGDQRTPSGIRLVFYCWACRGNDVLSAAPLPGPQPPPGGGGDVRRLRQRD